MPKNFIFFQLIDMKKFYNTLAYERWINKPDSDERNRALNRIAETFFSEIIGKNKSDRKKDAIERQKRIEKERNFQIHIARYRKLKSNKKEYEKLIVKMSEQRKIRCASDIHKNPRAIIKYFQPDPQKGTIQRPSYLNKAGFLSAYFHSKDYQISRIIWIAHTKKLIPKGYEICHKNLNKLDNKISNLECLTRIENFKRAKRLGLRKNKLKEQKNMTYQRVLQLKENGLTQKEIAQKIIMSQSSVQKMLKGEFEYCGH